ncbi:MAG: ABC transporter ATP-binding protein, partial [Clostridiales bacterium]|nr:ABC transporter ATP-binding protein [Clostridiales bacterium]
MVKLRGYLKPFLFGLLMSVLLLFVQAVTNLRLPSYMSDIVNVGIQQSGIERCAPEAISENGYAIMTMYMSENEKELVEQNYALVPVTAIDEHGKTYKSLYPNAAAKLYVLQKPDEATLNSLDIAFGAATWTMIYTFGDYAEQNGQSDSSAVMTSGSNVDLAKLYDFLPMLSMIPRDVLNASHEKALSNDTMILKQSGIMLTKAFYTELGLDLGAVQTAYILRIGLLMLGIALLGGFATILVSLLA